ncbi:MAG TPA: LLM class flavin-dependent oxidoreductase [Candidatus Nanopelagicaceae bacterium]|nr:LLM class flavin-dependent oxidoreductase [Candidatus Nanopelagicaceae bacterium]
MKIGVVILPDQRWETAAKMWKECEGLGFAHAWTYDHLTWRDLRDGPWFSAVPTLAAASLATSTIRLGTLVASPNFRHPVTFAKELMSLDDISNGRITLGIGAGGSGWDATALGQEPWTAEERAARFAEFVQQLDVLLTEPVVDSLTGKFYSARDARSFPGCLQQPRLPFAIAATGPKGIAVAVEFGQAWVTYGDPKSASTSDEVSALGTARDQIEKVREECGRQNRDFDSLSKIYVAGSTKEPWLSSVTDFRRLRDNYEQLGFTDVVIHRPRPIEPYQADVGVYYQIAELN